MTLPVLNTTHDPTRRSWIPSANRPDHDFPVQNLPWGVVRSGQGQHERLGVAIGDVVLDVATAAPMLDLSGGDRDLLQASTLDPLLAADPTAWSRIRRALFDLLAARENPGVPDGALLPMETVTPALPCTIGDYTDFYASRHHATNVGRMFRPDAPLLPNWLHLPVGYHGRASSLVPNRTPVRRPSGQREDSPGMPVFGPSRLLDYECEVGALLGGVNPLGTPVPIARAGERIFGLCLVNDWSARDIQKWEYQPLGPFLAKSFATTLSPWIVTSEALAPWRIPVAARAPDDPPLLPHLLDPSDQATGGFDLTLEVLLDSSRMRETGLPAMRVSLGSFREMAWTLAQMVAHHASNGCNLRPGDLLASGTVSGPEPESRGCLLERTWRGSEPLTLPGGEQRTFLEDGDRVTMRAWCDTVRGKGGAVRIGFGSCVGTVLPALTGMDDTQEGAA